jgi:hypothetical protein
VQSDIWVHYNATKPGEVQVLGVDLWNGTAGQLNSFRSTTGATYPLLLNGASSTGGNVETLYGTYDNYVVLNKQGVVRYHAALNWPHGNRYHLNEIRACVDTLVSALVDVPGTPAAGVAFGASPNPARGPGVFRVALPEPVADAEIVVHDLAGRLVATPWRGPLGAGRHELAWDARGASGAPLPAGLYLARARLGRETRTLRLALTR